MAATYLFVISFSQRIESYEWGIHPRYLYSIYLKLIEKFLSKIPLGF